MNWSSALHPFLCLFVYMLPWDQDQPLRPKATPSLWSHYFCLLKNETCHMQSDSAVENMVRFGPVDSLRTHGANARTMSYVYGPSRVAELHYKCGFCHIFYPLATF